MSTGGVGKPVELLDAFGRELHPRSRGGIVPVGRGPPGTPILDIGDDVACENCGCLDCEHHTEEVDIGVGVQEFDLGYFCPACGFQQYGCREPPHLLVPGMAENQSTLLFVTLVTPETPPADWWRRELVDQLGRKVLITPEAFAHRYAWTEAEVKTAMTEGILDTCMSPRTGHRCIIDDGRAHESRAVLDAFLGMWEHTGRLLAARSPSETRRTSKER